MYISHIRIQGFRNFKDTSVDLNDGVNVIIGHNNAGKSNLLRALQIVIEPHFRYRRLGIYDFCHSVSLDELKGNSPKVAISVTLKKSGQDYNETDDDLRMISTWLTKIEDDYEATLSYEYRLPQDKSDEYLQAVANAEDANEAWRILEEDFLRYYVYRIWGGVPEQHIMAEAEHLGKFDFQFVGAMRNVEDEMFYGRSPLLKEVLSFFIDYQIKSDTELDDDEKARRIKEIKAAFGEKSNDMMESLLERLSSGKEVMLDYARETGASFNKAKPDFKSTLSEADLFSALQLIIEYETGMKIAATHNGLGYNNLIYISLLLAKMQADSDGDYSGENAKVFPVLAIEEPEAHLHPAMQYKFLKFLKRNLQTAHKVRQIFVTSHSTQITAAVKLDEIICLHCGQDGTAHVGYPGKVFPDTDKGKASKNYVQRFLDATKSDMLFAQKVILVEGIAEELLMGTLSRYDGKSLEDEHVSVVNINGRYFNHFVRLFDAQASAAAIPKKVACITDRDPIRKLKDGGKWKACYPYEYGIIPDQYDYQVNGEAEEERYHEHPNIRFFIQNKEKGKTFEYDLVLHNPTLKLLITDSMANKDELTELHRLPYDQALERLRESKANKRIKESLAQCEWDEEEKKKALIASRYLNSIGKGENALELCVALEDNYDLPEGHADKQGFTVPSYIHEALEWLLR